MKYDINKELTRGAKRTLNDFKTMMFTLLSEKSFEEITVGELCKRANYPRATFYNYFEDKFDLLNYCWLWLTKEIHLEDYQYLPHDKTLHIFFDRIFDFSKENRKKIHSVLTYNSEIGYMFSSFRNFMNSQMRNIFRTCSDAEKSIVPNEVLADHYSNTLLLIWQWCNLKNQNCTKEQAFEYLECLIGNV